MFTCPDCGYKCQDEETGVAALNRELDALRAENAALIKQLDDLRAESSVLLGMWDDLILDNRFRDALDMSNQAGKRSTVK